jgi:hypothetical protein
MDAEREHLKTRLIRLMRDQHTGREMAAHKRDLLREFYSVRVAENESYNNLFDREIRLLIEEINQGGGLICSSSTDGYWWAESLVDGLPFAERNRSRALTQLGNAERLVDNLKSEFGGQLPLI